MLCYETLTSTPVHFASVFQNSLQSRGQCWASQMLTQVVMSMLHIYILTQLPADILIQKRTLDSASIATNFLHVTVT